jgi:hypothetical protein
MSQHHRKAWTSADAKRWRPRIAATLPAPCVDCGREVYPEQAWQVGHIQSLASFEADGYAGSATAENLGPSHRSCNARSGGRMGAAKTNGANRTKTRQDKGLPEW